MNADGAAPSLAQPLLDQLPVGQCLGDENLFRDVSGVGVVLADKGVQDVGIGLVFAEADQVEVLRAGQPALADELRQGGRTEMRMRQARFLAKPGAHQVMGRLVVGNLRRHAAHQREVGGAVGVAATAEMRVFTITETAALLDRRAAHSR